MRHCEWCRVRWKQMADCASRRHSTSRHGDRTCQPLSAAISKYRSPYGSYGGSTGGTGSSIRTAKTASPLPARNAAMMRPIPTAAARPLLAVVSLGDQRVTIYDAKGRILRSPVSTRRDRLRDAGRHLQRRAEEGGALAPTSTKTATCRSCSASPGRASPCTPACCPAIPPRTAACACRIAFAQRLFELTEIGMRVIIVRNDIAPADIEHPGSVQAEPARQELVWHAAPARSHARSSRCGWARPSANVPPPTRLRQARADPEVDRGRQGRGSRSRAQEGRREARAAAAQGRRGRACRQGAAARRRAARTRAEALLKGAEERSSRPHGCQPPSRPGSARSRPRAGQGEGAGQGSPRRRRSSRPPRPRRRPRWRRRRAPREEAKAAEAAKDAAQRRPRRPTPRRRRCRCSSAARRSASMSGRATSRCSRAPSRSGMPTSRSARYVFTALDYVNDGPTCAGALSSMYQACRGGAAPVPRQATRAGPTAAHPRPLRPMSPAAKAALDRIAIPQEASTASPRWCCRAPRSSSRTRALSIETGKDTDFVVRHERRAARRDQGTAAASPATATMTSSAAARAVAASSRSGTDRCRLLSPCLSRTMRLKRESCAAS